MKDAINWLTKQEKPKGLLFAERTLADIKEFRKSGWDAIKPK